MKLKNVVGRLAALLPAVLLAGGLLATPQVASAQGAPGAEACAQCHADTVKHFQSLTKHGVKTDARTPAATGGCATCHGDATAHIKAGGGKGTMKRLDAKNMPAEEKNAACISCHQGDPQRIHWQASVHAAREVACVSCHKVHKRDEVRDKLTQYEVCFNCHKEQRAQINKPSRHPVLEGKVACSDCHNVHGNNPKQMVKNSVVETCWQCHLEKRGPFVHNHQPVTEDCTICHQPHGTAIASLLKTRVPFLCQDCHATVGHPTQLAAIPDQRTTSASRLGTVGRGCLNCHTNIHGSNSTQNSATAGRFRR